MHAQLDEKLVQFCKEFNIPGLAIQVAKDGELLYERYEGFRDVANELPVNEDTIFGIASITKSFATFIMMILEEEGKLSIQDEVVSWLPELEAIQPGTTIHHLMTHSAGYTGLDAFHRARIKSIKKDPHGAYLFNLPLDEMLKEINTVEEMLTVMNEEDIRFIGPPGSLFNYSNESYAMLQLISERASGKDFKSLVENYILKPLQMNRTFFDTEQLAKEMNVTELYAHTKDRHRDVFHSPSWWDSGTIYSVGALKSTVHDLMRYLEMYRKKGTLSDVHFLKEKNIDRMLTSHITTPHGLQYGYGFLSMNVGDYTFIGHGGGIKGISSFKGLVEEAGLTVTVLTNISDVPAENAAMIALQEILHIEDNQIHTYIPIDEKMMEQYEGVYTSNEGQKVVVHGKDDYLVLEIEAQTLEAKRVNNHLFRLTDGKYIAFLLDESKGVKGMFRGMRYLEKV